MERRIIKHLGTLEDKKWPIEANIVSWNGGAPKLDIRAWEPDVGQTERKCGKGIALTEAATMNLQQILTDYLYEEFR